uniref:Putative capsid protein n=1 Tax=viral metagenome TaxID=1070528 RepID=A0A6M3MDY9_9ZZZZ
MIKKKRLPEEDEVEEDEVEDEEEDESEEEVEKAVDALAKKVEAKLNLKELEEKINKAVKRQGPDSRNIVGRIFTSGDVMKGVESLTKEEKIVGFFQGLLHNDSVVLKALAEGVAADGGYLFPDEILSPIGVSL